MNDVPNMWKKCRELATEFVSDLERFINQASCNEQFRYWSIFLNELKPKINDLTLSFRESNWLLHLSALPRAMPLFFTFDRSNFSRWVLLYYNDCIILDETFPGIFERFMNGDFTAQQGKRKWSVIPVDQALEKKYNKNAKGSGRINGFTREKEVVAKWTIIKHEKNAVFQLL